MSELDETSFPSISQKLIYKLGCNLKISSLHFFVFYQFDKLSKKKMESAKLVNELIS